MLILIVVLVAIIVFILVYLVTTLLLTGNRSNIVMRLAAYSGDNIATNRASLNDNKTESFLDFLLSQFRQIAKIFNSFRIASYWHARMQRAALPLRGSEFIGICTLAGMGFSLLALSISKGGFMAAILGALAGFVIPMIMVKMRISKRMEKFSIQLGDALVLMAGSLQSGYSFIQSVELAAKEMNPPIADEFGRLMREMNLGVPVEVAMENISQRLSNLDLDLVVTAVLIQRQVGGNLAEVLNNIAESIRERVRIRGEIQTLTAQGRMSGFIISMLPVALLGIMCFINYEYMSVLFKTGMGKMLLVIGVLSQALGIWCIKKIVDIDV